MGRKPAKAVVRKIGNDRFVAFVVDWAIDYARYNRVPLSDLLVAIAAKNQYF
jgi:hypothetical protein